MSNKRAVFYFMSGTGNTLRVAQWMAEEARGQGFACETRQIGRRQLRECRDEETPGLIGLLMPTHGFTAPWMAITFALGLRLGKGARAFVVATRGGTKFGSVRLPGLEGTACLLIALILAAKGYKVVGATAIDMPSNWIAFHSSLCLENVADIVGRAKPRAIGFINRIVSGRKYFHGAVPLLFGLMLLPISIGYLLMGRFFLGKLFFAGNKCTGCGQCATNCPVSAIRMIGGRKPRPYWSFDCENCMRCMAFCPVRAIEAGHSWSVLLYYVSSFPAAQLALVWAYGPIVWLSAERADTLAGRAIHYVCFLASMFLAYWVFWALIRIRPVNALFEFSTLTRIYRRYHEPGTKLRDLTDDYAPACR